MNKANLKQILEEQETFYSKRIGTVYGDFRVTKVWYDWGNHKQMWELECVKCGKVKITHNGKDYVKGKNRGICTCERDKFKVLKNLEKIKKAEESPDNPKWVGEVIGKWRVVGYKSSEGWLVECEKCGRQCYHYVWRIRSEKQPLCTCETTSEFIDSKWVGQRFGHLVIQKYVGCGKVECKCDCGKSIAVKGSHLLKNRQQTCGKECEYHRGLVTTHDLSSDRLYRIWHGMKQRCYNSNSPNYPTYGGRGIDICDEWFNDVVAFRNWALSHGYSDDLSIDRIDNDKGYSPDNCRWATVIEQNNNKHPAWTFTPKKPYRKKKLKTWTIDGVTKPITEWCKECGMTVQSVTYRVITKGMSPKEALATPKQQGSHKFNVANSLE
jgi:hypothetical protein